MLWFNNYSFVTINTKLFYFSSCYIPETNQSVCYVYYVCWLIMYEFAWFMINLSISVIMWIIKFFRSFPYSFISTRALPSEMRAFDVLLLGRNCIHYNIK